MLPRTGPAALICAICLLSAFMYVVDASSHKQIHELSFDYKVSSAWLDSSFGVDNSSPLLADAGMHARTSSIAQCSLFIPHLHPKAAEYLVVVKGSLHVALILDDRLVKRDLGQGDALLIPANTLHTVYNKQCQQAISSSVYNDPEPGYQGYEDVPSDILLNNVIAEDFARMMKRQKPTTRFETQRAFRDLKSHCQERCNPTAAPKPSLLDHHRHSDRDSENFPASGSGFKRGKHYDSTKQDL